MSLRSAAMVGSLLPRMFLAPARFGNVSEMNLAMTHCHDVRDGTSVQNRKNSMKHASGRQAVQPCRRGWDLTQEKAVTLIKKALRLAGRKAWKNSRGERIRTSDLLNPI